MMPNFPDPKLKARAPLTFKPTHLMRFKRVVQGYTFKASNSILFGVHLFVKKKILEQSRKKILEQNRKYQPAGTQL